MINRISSPTLTLIVALAVTPANAFERMSGCFVADRTCSAKSTIRKDRNPGSIKLEAGRTYQLLGANKQNATHYQLRIPGANPRDRWVGATCGRVTKDCNLPVSAAPEQAAAIGLPKSISTNNVIAISWQPAFCQTHQSKKECASQTAERYDADHFTLHGLWPQPRSNIFCGVTPDAKKASRGKRWGRLPRLPLSAALRAKLDKVMPGTQSMLQRHEWIKHGTCFGADPEAYYAASLAVVEQINASAAQKLFAANVGRELSFEQVRAAFDDAFGQGAGERVTMSCSGRGKRRLIVELIVGLGGRIGNAPNVAELIKAANPRRAGCKSGYVDTVGY